MFILGCDCDCECDCECDCDCECTEVCIGSRLHSYHVTCTTKTTSIPSPSKINKYRTSFDLVDACLFRLSSHIVTKLSAHQSFSCLLLVMYFFSYFLCQFFEILYTLLKIQKKGAPQNCYYCTVYVQKFLIPKHHRISYRD